MYFTQLFALSLAIAPLTLAATVPKQVKTKSGAVSKAPSVTKEDVINGLPCPGLRALALNKKLDAIVKDWSNPKINLAQATDLFQKSFNLQPDFSKFTIGGGSKLSKGGDGSISLVDIRTWDGAHPIPGQIVHVACMSRADPQNDATDGILTPRPFDAATFSKYTARIKGSEITIPIQAAARKGEVDLHKDTIGPLQWFNFWAESALLLSVLSADGKAKSVRLQTVKDFFEKGALPSAPPTNPIGMAQLSLVTAELIFEAYKTDLPGLTSLLKRFATEGIANALKGVNIAAIANSVVQRIGTNSLAATIKGLFSKLSR